MLLFIQSLDEEIEMSSLKKVCNECGNMSHFEGKCHETGNKSTRLVRQCNWGRGGRVG